MVGPTASGSLRSANSSTADATGTPPWAIALILVAVLGAVVAGGVRWQRSRHATTDRELDEHGDSRRPRANTVDMVSNPLATAHCGGFPAAYDTVEPPAAAMGATFAAVNGAYELPDPAQPAVYDVARKSSERLATSCANPTFALTTPAPAQDGQHSAQPDRSQQAQHGVGGATPYYEYQSREAMQVTQHADHQGVSARAPRADAAPRAKDELGYVDHVVSISQAAAAASDGGHVYAVPMESPALYTTPRAAAVPAGDGDGSNAVEPAVSTGRAIADGGYMHVGGGNGVFSTPAGRPAAVHATGYAEATLADLRAAEAITEA